jgi:hypothetical protein
MPVFHTPFGRVACTICYDIWFPEVCRMAAAGGADILCVPTNWVPMPAQPAELPAMANLLAMGGAHWNGLFVAAADRVGVERDQPLLGRSLIADSQGWPAAGPASPTDEEILVASVNLADARRHRQLNAFTHVLRDRRPYMYCEGRSIVSVHPLAAFIRPYKRGTLTRHWHIQPNSRFALRLDLTFSHRYTPAVHQRKARGSAP